jgi:hypothetical protein
MSGENGTLEQQEQQPVESDEASSVGRPSIFDDEISPAVQSMRYESIRGKSPPPSYSMYGTMMQSPNLLRQGVYSRRTMKKLMVEDGPAWTVWAQLLYALFLVLIIVLIVITICAMWRYFDHKY